jgi:HK97 family phage prohead protease
MSNHLEIKANLSVSDEGQIEGIAWPFGTPDRAGDTITKGAFAEARAPLPLLFGHDPDQPIGVWDSIQETTAGLIVKGKLLIADVQRAREAHALVKAGAMRGLSIGFRTKSATPRKGGGRTISALELVECSLVTIPCHPGARVTSAKDASRALALAEAINRAASALRSKGS